jgi:hypothetical protein
VYFEEEDNILFFFLSVAVRRYVGRLATPVLAVLQLPAQVMGW